MPDFLLVLALHYVISEGRKAPDGDTISFAQVPSGTFYLPAFDRGTKARLIDTFGRHPALFSRVADELCWDTLDQGDPLIARQ